MNTVVVTFGFSFRCAQRGALHVFVKWGLAENDAADADLSHKLDMKNGTDETSYRADKKITAKMPSVVRFQFCVQYQDREYSSAVGSYRISSTPRETIAIGDIERGENETQHVTLRFKMNYQTYFGQNVIIVGSLPELGFWDISKGLALDHCGSAASTANGLFSDTRFNWQRDLKLPRAPDEMSYGYFVVSPGSQQTVEPGGLRCFVFKKGDGPANYEFDDVWRWSEHAQNKIVKRLFDNSFSVGRPMEVPGVECQESPEKVNCVFSAHCAIIGKARSIVVVGSIPELGQWTPSKGVPLRPAANLQWTATVAINKNAFPFEYKFVATSGEDTIVWEPNDNRKATMSKWSENEIPSCVAIDSWHLSFSNIAFHGAGVFVDVQSVRCKGSFFDFKVMTRITEWAGRAGFAAVHFIGLLDTTAMTTDMDDLPVSGAAINPLFCDFSSEEDVVIKGTDPKQVLEQKLAALKKIWTVYCKEVQVYQYKLEEFAKTNAWWLRDYEKLCFSKVSDQDEKEYSEFVRFVQYYCYEQLASSIIAARDSNVAVGIDLPFALSENSAEALAHPELFMKDYRLGIPPSRTNPIGVVLNAYPYDFTHAAKWFAERVEHFGSTFSIIRLSSTINFFRQWIVPRKTCVRAVFGRFDPAVSIPYAELETWGLWDIERYTRPYIRLQLVEDLFTVDKYMIDTVFLDHTEECGISFKPRFATELDLVTAKLEPAEDEIRSRNIEGLLRLLGEVLLIQVGPNEYHPRVQLQLAPMPHIEGKPWEVSSSFNDLPSFHQAPLRQIHNEFILNRQRCLWASTGSSRLRGLGSAITCMVFSDAAGANGELCEEALQGMGILPFRAHLEGRSPNSNFDDIRGYPYFSIAAPTADTKVSFREIWNTNGQKRKHLWEDEFYEMGSDPREYNDRVATAMMKLHCWSGSMWVMFPLDSLIGAAEHLVKTDDGSVVIDIDSYCDNKDAIQKILNLLKAAKRT